MKLDPTIFRAYDIRGEYPNQLDEGGVYVIIQAYVKIFKPRKVVVSRDVREHGPQLQRAAIKSFLAAGVDVIDAGLVSTDMFYWAVASLGVDGGVTISASHNPRQWNGLNLAKKGARPISAETGINQIKELALKNYRVRARRKGKLKRQNILDRYAKFILSLVKAKQLPKIKMVVNPNCGYQGVVMERIIELGKLPIELFKINFQPDGTFPIPEGHPNPLIPANRQETIAAVKKNQADLGVSWDADGDRCFFVDEKGNFIEGYFTTAVLAKEQLKKHPGGKVIIDPRLIWASIDAIKQNGGTPLISKAGMTIIADKMIKEKAIFAGEMSAHYYFPETFNRDNGILPIFRILELMCSTRQKLSQIYRRYFETYFISGEINHMVENIPLILNQIEKKYHDGKIEHIDGLSVEYSNWRFNLRGSNTEPLLRLNVEARSQKLMERQRDEILKLIQNR